MIHPSPKIPVPVVQAVVLPVCPWRTTALCCSFQEQGSALWSGFPHTQVGVWLEHSLFGTLAQHQSQMKCLGRCIPKTAGGGSVIPKWISSLLLDVSNCECHISNYVALECVFKLFCYSKESFQQFKSAFLCVCLCVYGLVFVCLFCFCNLPMKWALCLQKVVVILFYLWPFLDAFWVSLSKHTCGLY